MSFLELRRLDASNPSHIFDLQRIFEESPKYFFKTTGQCADSNAARDALVSIPTGFSIQNKYVFGIFLGETMIGCMDFLRGFPRESTAMLGLLLLGEYQIGKGLGRVAFQAAVERIKEWKEIQRLRIGVIRTNESVLGFWKRLGFEPTGEVKPYISGQVSSNTVVLERGI